MRFLILLLLPAVIMAQPIQTRLGQAQKELQQIQAQEKAILDQIETLKLEQLRNDLHTHGLPELLPGELLIDHQAMSLVYSEEHEQAKWVSHIILPDIIQGTVSRTNKFLVDPKVATGSAEEADYFLKYLQPDSTYKYDGYGFDRGHLAPSADFRWSQTALAESYFYSNMSPQAEAFNRDIWAALESHIRGYLYRNPNTQLYVVTGPLLTDELPKSKRSVNQVSVPRYFWKVILDLNTQQAIGFLIPNKGTDYPISTFVKSVDEIEKVTGINFFTSLDDHIENQVEANYDLALWLPEESSGDAEPFTINDLGTGKINTIMAKRWMGSNRKIKVCGTAVSTRISQKGNILINLDKQYPGSIFTVFIRKPNIINFPYQPEQELLNQRVCVRGKVSDLSGLPAMFIENDKQLEILEE